MKSKGHWMCILLSAICFSLKQRKIINFLFANNFSWMCLRKFTKNFKLAVQILIMWCNSFLLRKWTWWLEFKFWMRLLAFHFLLIPLGKAWIHLSSASYRKIVEQTGFYSLGKATGLEGKFWIQTLLLKNWPWITSYPWQRGWVNTNIVLNIILRTKINQKHFFHSP